MIDRMPFIVDFCRDKSVLDIGCAEGNLGARINVVSKTYKGTDLLYGEDFRDVTDRGYDVVVAGELIEHLTDYGALFATTYKVLRLGGTFILSTPNPFKLNVLFNRIFGCDKDFNSSHTAWFDKFMLERLFRKYGFVGIHSLYAFAGEDKDSWKKTLMRIAYNFNHRWGMSIICWGLKK